MDNASQVKRYSDQELNTFFKIRKTFLKMLEDRGYIISNEEREKKLEEWKSGFGESILGFLTSKKGVDDELIYVEFSNTPKLGVSEVTSFAERLHAQGVRNGIIIYKDSITSPAKQV